MPNLLLLDGCTFFLSEQNGDVESHAPEGFFYGDVRHLSQWRVLIDGEPLKTLTSRAVDYFSGRVVAAPEGKDPPLTVERNRFVTDGAHEDIVVYNHSPEHKLLELDICFAADFADIIEAQEPGAYGDQTEIEVSSRSVMLSFEQDGFRRATRITFNRAGDVRDDRVVFKVELKPQATWELGVDITPIEGRKPFPPLLGGGAFGAPEPQMPETLHEWLATAPQLEARDNLQDVYHRSLIDLAALRIRPRDEDLHYAMPAGGVPWFLAVVGRDSLLTSYEALPFKPTLARSTLKLLAEYQATGRDDFRDAEPGKILHELRRGKLAKLGIDPHRPYYGAHDTTSLFLIVLDEYERWTGDADFVRRLEPNARAALRWLDEHGDLDGDGYLEYESRSAKGLKNHCWKDSDDSIQYADGRAATGPIATCEIQGYAYDARLRVARLVREFLARRGSGPRAGAEGVTATRALQPRLLERRARHLRAGARRKQAPGRRGHVEPRPPPLERHRSEVAGARRRRSAPRRGHVQRLGDSHAFRRDARLQPARVHCGTVWPHDSAICAEGMRRYGLRAQAGRVCEALLEAAIAFEHRLPELFGGFERDETDIPVPYPDALAPQAWAAAAPLLALRTMLGARRRRRQAAAEPKIPKALGTVALRKLRVRGRSHSAG